MKKVLITALFAGVVGSAAATEFGITAARDFAGTASRNSTGVSLGQQFGRVDVTAGFERFTKGANDQTRYSLTGSYPVAKFGRVSVAAQAGAAFLDNKTTADGYARVAGVGAVLPVAKHLSLGVDYGRQFGQYRVRTSTGNTVGATLKYSF